MTTEDLSTEARMWKLVQRLHAKTAAGELQWDKTVSKNTFQTAFPSYVVRVSVDYPEDAEAPDYHVAVRDGAGTTIESVSDRQVHNALPDSNAFTLMGELFTMARRTALGVNQALESLLNELN
jgi:hypothetical protein